MNSRPRMEDFADHVEHPRYGSVPRFTGLDPNPDAPEVHLHWNTGCLTQAQIRTMERLLGWCPAFPDDGTRVVRGTAVAADLSRQTPATVPVTHYYDVDKVCRDCGRRFIFFADEQKHWYEELGFPLEADAVCCTPCRKRLQRVARMRARYEQLVHVPLRTTEETLEMADCCLGLIEEAIFHPRQTQRVRMLLNRIPGDRRSEQRFQELKGRVRAAETMGKVDDPPNGGPAMGGGNSGVREGLPAVG